MKIIITIFMLLSLTFSMGAQTDSLITRMLDAAVINDGNISYKIDRTTHFFTRLKAGRIGRKERIRFFAKQLWRAERRLLRKVKVFGIPAEYLFFFT